jgi:hypothetical protein
MKAVVYFFLKAIFVVTVASLLITSLGATYLRENCEELIDAPGICRVVEISGLGAE